MNEELNEIIKILKKILPKLVKNPRTIEGFDVSNEEVNEIIKTKKISIEVLEHLAGDIFFEAYFDELNLTKEEAKETALFLQKTARYHLKELQKEFPFIKE